MLKSFRSSDKKGDEGIQFGDDWYSRLMVNLDSASDVVCLLTERSLDRPWILYEAGVAKGKLNTPVHGVALGIALNRVATGPFYQFQNCDDNIKSISKLVLQLCKRIPGLEPDVEVVNSQVEIFKNSIKAYTTKAEEPRKQSQTTSTDDGATAKVLEEMKLMVRELPMRIEKNIYDERPFKSRKNRRFDPMLLDEIAHKLSQKTDDSIGILFISSIIRDDFPWLYELGVDVYHTAKTGDHNETLKSLEALSEATKFLMHGPFMEFLVTKETHGIIREFPMIIDQYIRKFKMPMRNYKGHKQIQMQKGDRFPED